MKKFLMFNSSNGMLCRSVMVEGEIPAEDVFNRFYPSVTGIEKSQVDTYGPLTEDDEQKIAEWSAKGEVPKLDGGSLTSVPLSEWEIGGGLEK